MAGTYPRTAGELDTPRSMGILTRTVIDSPVVRWILHARIRRKLYNDVIFVGDDYIHVKQVGAGGHLEHVATKNDFDGRIRAAKAISMGPDPWEEPLFVKSEEEKAPAGVKAVPQDLLALTLDSQDVVFLYLGSRSDGTLQFVQQTCPLPVFDSVLSQLGEHLAIDPYSRAIAVAANEKEVMIFATKRKEQIERELQLEHGNWYLISAQRPLQVDGVIHHIDFLFPPADDEDHIILLLIVIDERKTKAIWIDWYDTSDLHDAHVHPPQPLDTTRTVSSLLVPLRDAAFMIINESDVKLWTHLLSGSLTCNEPESLDGDPQHPGNSSRRPVWTSWCRPLRSLAARRTKDAIYLIREDGLVCYVNVEGDRMTSSSAGHLRCHAGTAFASLGVAHTPDILAVVGDMSNGCVVSIGHWPTTGEVLELSWNETTAMALTETIPNWASVTDMIATPLRHSQGKSSRSLQSRPSILVTSGRQPYGSITELRNGLEARLSAYFELDDLQSVTDTWALPLAADGSVLVFMANPSATRVLKISGDFEPAELDPDECSALDLTAQTLAAAADSDGHIFQVTARTIGKTAGLEANFEDTTKKERTYDDSILCADILSEKSIIITAERRGNENFLCCTHFASVGVNDEALGSNNGETIEETSIQLQSEPTAVALTPIISSALAAVTLAEGRLCFFQILRDLGISNVAEVSLPCLQGTQGICDHVIFLLSPVNSDLLAVCGLRDGTLHCLKIQINGAGAPVLSGCHTFNFGQSTVKLTQLTRQHFSACAMSGTDTCLLTWDGRSAQSLDIKSIWISDKSRPELAQGAITAATRMPGAESLASAEMADLLILISNTEFLAADLAKEPSTVPRQLHVKGTPTRLLYAEQQRCLIAASNKTGTRPFPSSSGRPEERRQIWPIVDFIPSRSSEPSFSYDLQPGERVYALLEWSYKPSEDKVYSYILVGGSHRRSNGSTAGRVWFLQPSNKNWEIIDVKERAFVRFDAPVYALALYDELTYVACSGHHILMYQYSVDSGKWQDRCAPYELASPGVYVTVEAPLIFVSTAQDSLVTLRYEPDHVQDGGALPRLTAVCHGPQAEESLSHLIVRSDQSSDDGCADLALLSTKYGTVVGLSSTSPASSVHTYSNAASTLFEADLPKSVTRLRRSNVRPDWKPASPPGVLVDNIVGTAPDGALFGFAILDQRLWRRLSWLQRLCEWSEELSPRLSHSPAYTVSHDIAYARGDESAFPIGLSLPQEADTAQEILLRTSASRESHKHIDGDILARVLEQGGSGTLKTVIRQAAQRDDRVGAWITEHLHEELQAADEMVNILRQVLDCWV